jgi:hypothetical protein
MVGELESNVTMVGELESKVSIQGELDPWIIMRGVEFTQIAMQGDPSMTLILQFVRIPREKSPQISGMPPFLIAS